MEDTLRTPRRTVRPARPTDLAALQSLLARCSDATLVRRFHGPAGAFVRQELRRIAAPSERHRSWVAVVGDDVRGTATLAWGADGEVEVAFLVEDAWMRSGLGADLLAAALDEARRAGLERVLARLQGDNEPARRFLQATVPGARTSFAGAGELDVSLPTVALPTGPIRLSTTPTPATPAPHLGRTA